MSNPKKDRLKKLSVQAASLAALLGTLGYFGNLGYATYSMVVDMHSQYATKEELRDNYFQTKIDDWNGDKDDLEDRISFYETKMMIEDGLSQNDTDRLQSTRIELKSTVEMIAAFDKSIRGLD